MKNLKFVVLAVVVAALMVTGVSLKSAQATALTNTEIDLDTFWTFAGDGVVPLLISQFDYSPLTTGGDGEVWSLVREGIGDAAGLYVYLYGIVHFAGSSEVEVGGISFDFITNPTLTPVDGMTSWQITDDPFGTIALTFADWTGGAISFGGSPPVPWIAPGESSRVFGTFSPLPPGIVTADVLDTGATIASADVLTPVPEPASMMLLGSGLVGVAAFARRKWLARR